ncbi:MAG: damage-control phosphatase ARMT1 family protein [Planctomycetota bacterium]
MRTFLDCIPCFVRQALDATRFVTDDVRVHERVLREVLAAASEMDLTMTPPEMGLRIHRAIRELTGEADPYREVKDRFNAAALALYPELKQRVCGATDRLAAAARLAIAGNIIDFGVRGSIGHAEVKAVIDGALDASLEGTVDAFRTALAEAERILYLADNAGEIVCDRLLVEELPPERVVLAVKGSPIINDATLADAEAAGLTDLVEVIDNGSDAPGTLLRTCSEAFRRRFDAADVVIAKGQANYETLSEADQDIFFLLQAKCAVIARDLACPQGSFVLRRHRE